MIYVNQHFFFSASLSHCNVSTLFFSERVFYVIRTSKLPAVFNFLFLTLGKQGTEGITNNNNNNTNNIIILKAINSILNCSKLFSHTPNRTGHVLYGWQLARKTNISTRPCYNTNLFHWSKLMTVTSKRGFMVFFTSSHWMISCIYCVFEYVNKLWLGFTYKRWYQWNSELKE